MLPLRFPVFGWLCAVRNVMLLTLVGLAQVAAQRDAVQGGGAMCDRAIGPVPEPGLQRPRDRSSQGRRSGAAPLGQRSPQVVRRHVITIEGEFASRYLLFVLERRDARSSAPVCRGWLALCRGGGMLSWAWAASRRVENVIVGAIVWLTARAWTRWHRKENTD